MSVVTTKIATVEIRDLAHGGAGVGKALDGDDARVWFVDGALPGERVRASLDAEHKSWLRGHTLEVLEPSPARVAPPCPLADRCGGCTWQHVDAAAQAQLKADIVANQLRKLPAPTPVAVPSPSALGYRRRARVHYQRDPGREGEGFALGFYGQRSHEIVDADRCPVLDPALDWAVQQVRAWARWLPESGSVHGLSNGAEVVLGLPGVRPTPELEAAIRAVIEASAPAEGSDSSPSGPSLVGVQLRAGRARVGVGRTWLELDGDGPTPPVSQGPFTFSQAQAAQNAALVAHVVEMAAPADRRVLELHAGVGNFSRALARSAKRVWTVDGDREAVANLQRTVERWGLPINAKRGQAEKLLAKLAGGGRHYDVVVCDPPRAGIGAQAARDLAAVARERIVYVSCDPATLARDLSHLAGPDAAFELVDLRVFDMMPMTAEVEVVATLVRRGQQHGAG
ncbi:23S rRNA (uracil-C(5))-methyltransferase RlmCD [Enhygromyxa salina]|uniref:23S rRNA (Uracil-C(5))-methyltransferase RlmCD n=1 Tax=Enhygromyxa salina TaxID=215803 RepID=A0A2S9XCK9_9BACT|nr:RsmD family RNA methyltransferase [Enhygromyxa salina]PRP90540.1 23S rRNA (uracil-C(5))-methyltransferase RlmCD [Enhygromyxa salina]